VKRLRSALVLATTLLLVTVWSVVMLAVALLTLFRARDFYSRALARPLAVLALRLCGVRLRVIRHAAPPAGQVVYIANHSSTLDMFILLALGLPRTRFFMTGIFRPVLPVWVIGAVLGTFWTVPQQYTEERRRIFARADRILRRTGESVFLSPEGRRITTGGIGHFNKGSFHLAASLGAPIVPLHIRIPDEVNPWRAYLPGVPGTVEVHVLPAIDTRGWRVEDAALHAAEVRELYVRMHEAPARAAAAEAVA
jgi:1-acyl-sn-glycerol-3-phosphate acyltransferase